MNKQKHQQRPWLAWEGHYRSSPDWSLFLYAACLFVSALSPFQCACVVELSACPGTGLSTAFMRREATSGKRLRGGWMQEKHLFSGQWRVGPTCLCRIEREPLHLCKRTCTGNVVKRIPSAVSLSRCSMIVASNYMLLHLLAHLAACCSMLQHVAACCSMLQHVAARCSTLQHVAARCSTL